MLDFLLAQVVGDGTGFILAEDAAILDGTFHRPSDAGVQKQLSDLILEYQVLAALDGLVILHGYLLQSIAYRIELDQSVN